MRVPTCPCCGTPLAGLVCRVCKTTSEEVVRVLRDVNDSMGDVASTLASFARSLRNATSPS